jgi:hypothetical protein
MVLGSKYKDARLMSLTKVGMMVLGSNFAGGILCALP